MIRSGKLHHLFPATFPSGQGSDLAGVVAELGPGVSGFAVDDEVIGFSMRRSSHTEYVTVPANQLTPRPATVPWEVAGSLFVAGVTSYAAVRAVRLVPGDTVAIAGAAGGVGSIAVQLARRAGATVLGIAGPSNNVWLADHGAIPVNYGDDLPARSVPPQSPGTSTPCWISSVGAMSPWRSKTSESRATGLSVRPVF